MCPASALQHNSSMRARVAASPFFRPPLVSGLEVQIVKLVKILAAASLAVGTVAFIGCQDKNKDSNGNMSDRSSPDNNASTGSYNSSNPGSGTYDRGTGTGTGAYGSGSGAYGGSNTGRSSPNYN